MRMCVKCRVKPVRLRNGQEEPTIAYCMECAEEHQWLEEGDSSPQEPEGFAEFVAIVNGGSL
jgi:hypothetical protein